MFLYSILHAYQVMNQLLIDSMPKSKVQNTGEVCTLSILSLASTIFSEIQIVIIANARDST